MNNKDRKRKEYENSYRKANREKIMAYGKVYRKANREKLAAHSKAYREANRERRAAQSKAYREANRERIAAKSKAYYEANRERRAAQSKAYNEANRERIAAQKKAYREANRGKYSIYHKSYNQKNRERLAAQKKAYKKNNYHLVIEWCRKRRAIQKNALVPFTAKEKEALIVLECTRQELQKETGRAYHIDHILPIAHGGIHHPVNLRILEGEENISKQDKLLPEAIALAPEHFRLYSERVSPERAWEFVRQLADGLGLSEDDLDALISGKPLKGKPTLEDFFT
jgi:hypothetical protein